MPPVPVLRPQAVVRRHIATLSVPNHSQVTRGTLRAVIAKAGVSVDEFIAALES